MRPDGTAEDFGKLPGEGRDHVIGVIVLYALAANPHVAHQHDTRSQTAFFTQPPKGVSGGRERIEGR